MESNYIRAMEVALLVLLFITFLSALLFLFYEILICSISRDIARNRTTSDPERGTEGLDAGEIVERAVGSESQTLLRIHEALGALRPRNQQQQQPQPGNDKRKGVIRSLPEPESYGSRYQRK
ncbi:uncharacterized protein LOC111304754 [Durio zibethinus]|uniref:Uncharacterized protein LOC111304754 n=1 Tax=Durio zibethinus TaxID=66656 RepID=A0A6P5ZY20_DURZI|nr:uncharacterized protein LOC111304754 [Durio zibethinus]